MTGRVAIVGAGFTGARSATPELSWKELMYRAAAKAYGDAGLDPRREVDSFVTCAEDYWEGFSIFDEFVPDQLGGAQRNVCTVAQDGLNGLAHGWMQIRTGRFDVVAVESHSKASDMVTFAGIGRHAYDPVYNRPLGFHPFMTAGLDMAAYLRRTGSTSSTVDAVAARNRSRALANPEAAYEAKLSPADVEGSAPLFDPLRRLHVAGLADGAVVLVMASERRARDLTDRPVWVTGVGFASATPWLEEYPWGTAPYAQIAARMAFRVAGREPREVEVAEVDDRFAHKELVHIEAMGLGGITVNPSGGVSGVGNLLEANGLRAAYDVVKQLRGEAGRIQVDHPAIGLAQSWRGAPTSSGAVALLEVDG